MCSMLDSSLKTVVIIVAVVVFLVVQLFGV